MRLCSNRPEGFGPKSILAAPLPTSCFIDTVLLPLPIWLALATLPVLFLLSFRHRKRNYDPSTRLLREKRKHNCLYILTNVFYYGLILANILMQTLEIVRLALLGFGISLLPFVYIGLILGALLHWNQGFKGRIRGWQIANAIVWIGGVAMSVVKVAGLSNEGIDGRKGSKYPVSDQVLDIAVMAGVYAAISLLEIALGVWRAFRTPNAFAESVRSDEGLDKREVWAPKGRLV